jgi:hypothetical protein
VNPKAPTSEVPSTVSIQLTPAFRVPVPAPALWLFHLPLLQSVMLDFFGELVQVGFDI